MSDRRQSIQWLFAELLVVVLGILIAFYADGLRQSKADRAEELSLLAALRGELQENRSALEQRIEVYSRKGNAAETLLALPGSEPLLAPDSLQVLWQLVLTPGTWNPTLGRSTAILSSGRLNLLQDPEVRAAVAGWPSQLESFLEVELSWRNFLRNEIEPWLDASVPMAAGGSRTGALDAGVSGPPTPTAEATLSLIGDPVLRNYLTRFVVWSDWTHRGGRRLVDRIDLTLGVIQEAVR
jgi:type II secretory pathway pseudopilin PulG